MTLSSIPQGTFQVSLHVEGEDVNTCVRPLPFDLHQNCKGKKVVIFGLPGAFTPTCHQNHVGPYVEKAAEFKAKGVDKVYCVASNDAFVLGAWAKVLKTGEHIEFLADGNLDWLKKADLTQDFSAYGMGTRSKRFALIADDLKVTYLGIESAGGVTNSGAEAVLGAL